MILKIINSFCNLDKKTLKIMKNGLKFCIILCIISCFILLTYNFFITSPNVYYIGILILQISLYYMVDFIICGFVVSNIKNHII